MKTPQLIKRLGKSRRLRGVLCRLAALYIRFVYATGHWRVEGGETAARFWDQGQPFILAFWHEHLLMMPMIWRREVDIHMLISQHRDGQLIAQTVSHFGIHWLAGSSTRGGQAALRTMLKVLKAGQCVGITPDGPHGPRLRASDGIAAVARLSGCPVIPAVWSSAGQRRLKSWDRFRIALPFSRGVFMWGDPIEIGKDAGGEAMEDARLRIEDALNTLTERADIAVGQMFLPPVPRAVPECPA